MEENEKMDHAEMVSLMSYVTRQLKERLPKGGCSIMFTSDGQGSVHCHVMGKENDIFKILCNVLTQNDTLYKLVNVALTAVQIEREIKNEVSERFEELLDNFVKSKSKDAVDSDKEAETAAATTSDADSAHENATDGVNE